MNRHAADPVSLIFGVAFLVAAVAWLLTRLVAVQLPPAGWIVASGLVLMGVLGLISTGFQRRQTPGR
jgi:hypothetical protein